MATQPRPQVAESAFSYLHMELVEMALGGPPGSGTYSTSHMQHAGRIVEGMGFDVGVRLVERYTKDRPRFTDTLEIIKFLCKDFWMETFRKQIDKLQTNNRVGAAPPQRFFFQVPLRQGPEWRMRVRAILCVASHGARRLLFFLTLGRGSCASLRALLRSQGVYMLQDNAHPMLARCSAATAKQATAKQLASLHIKFPAGLIRGALHGLGVAAAVSAEVSEQPKCQFVIRLASQQPAQNPVAVG